MYIFFCAIKAYNYNLFVKQEEQERIKEAVKKKEEQIKEQLALERKEAERLEMKVEPASPNGNR